MTDLDDPREQLRVIRSLMERATIYRALSAPTALVGGLLSLGAYGIAWHAAREGGGGLTAREFLFVWLGVLVLTGVCNLFFLWRGASRRGEIFFSAGMKTALASLAPSFVLAGILSCVLRHPIDMALAWIVLYGLGLLATQHFAPRSLAALGLAFLASGCVMLLACRHLLFFHSPFQPTAQLASGLMAMTFGGIHLVYAAAVWLRGEEGPETTGAGHV